MQVSIKRDILNSFEPQESVNMLGGVTNILLKIGCIKELFGSSLFHKLNKPEKLKELYESYVKS